MIPCATSWLWGRRIISFTFSAVKKKLQLLVEHRHGVNCVFLNQMLFYFVYSFLLNNARIDRYTILCCSQILEFIISSCGRPRHGKILELKDNFMKWLYFIK